MRKSRFTEEQIVATLKPAEASSVDEVRRKVGISRNTFYARIDNGPEFISKAVDAWDFENGVALHFIRPAKPTENGHIESFNGRLRDECLNVNWFIDLADAKEKIDFWRKDYNEVRPHSSSNYLTPMEYINQLRGVA